MFFSFNSSPLAICVTLWRDLTLIITWFDVDHRANWHQSQAHLISLSVRNDMFQRINCPLWWWNRKQMSCKNTQTSIFQRVSKKHPKAPFVATSESLNEKKESSADLFLTKTWQKPYSISLNKYKKWVVKMQKKKEKFVLLYFFHYLCRVFWIQ